jgi:hypothetical protein
MRQTTIPIATTSTAPITAPAIVAAAGAFDGVEEGVGDCSCDVDDVEVDDAVIFISEAMK